MSQASSLPSSGSSNNLTGSTSNDNLAGIHHNQYPCTSEGYDVVEEIGTGAFAKVYRAIVKSSGEQIAIKVMDLDQFNTNWDEVRREIATMSFLHHPNMVNILTSFVDGQDLWIIMPLLEAGSCAHIIKQIAPKGFKDEALIVTILRETLKGLAYLHKDGRIHRDVKAGNILIGSTGQVQLADFGVATTLLENGDRKKNRSTFTGTPCWMAPEVMEHGAGGYDEKADIWSFGITAMELAYGRAPYSKFQPMKVMVLTLQEDPPTCEIFNDNSYTFSKNFKNLIEKCLRKQPSKRPNAKKLLEHKIFKDAKDADYIVEHLISKLPKPATPSDIPRPHICREKSAIDLNKAEKNKPISVGSFVFDKEELAEFKRQHGDAVRAEHSAMMASLPAPSPGSPTHSDDDDNSNEHHQVQHDPQQAGAAAYQQYGGQYQQHHLDPGNVYVDPNNPYSHLRSDSFGSTPQMSPNQGEQQGRFFVSEENDDGGGPVFHDGGEPVQVGRFAVTEDQ